MQVTTQYASEHFEELLASAQSGEEIEIAREGQPPAKLIVMPAPALNRTPRFGTGRGDITLPSDEEGHRMDKELESVMLDSPLTSRVGE